jgi:drug/metabolite transporter (DMT)-like permease
LKRILAPLAVIFAALLWSLDGLLRQELYHISSFVIVALEHSIGALIFLPFLFKSIPKIKKLGQRGWISIFWISICGGVLGTYFYTKALSFVNYIDLSVVVLIQKLQPLFAISLAGVILKEKLSKRFMFLAVIAMFGGYLVTFGNKPFGNWDDKSTIASLCALLASFCWGSSTVLGKHALKQLTFEVVTGMRLFITAIIALIIIAYSGGFSDVSSLRPENYTTIIIIVFSTGTIALSIYYYGLQNLAASHTTIYELAWPLSAVFIDWTLKGKTLSLVQIVGALILLCSMGMLTRENQSE